MDLDVPENASLQGLIYNVFQRSLVPSSSLGLVVVLVAAQKGAGTTQMTSVLASALREGSGNKVKVLDSRELSDGAGPLELATDANRGKHGGGTLLDGDAPNGGSWRADPAFRANYLTYMRQRYRYVLVDCPALSERPDILGLASLVDGVLLVTEANKTTKTQIAHLERTIEAAEGRILGHVLTKRTYPIPEWLHTKMQRWSL